MRFNVKNVPAAVLLGICLAGTSVGAAVVNFDDLTPGFIPSSYDGFNWGPDWAVEDNADYNAGYGNSVTFPSAPNAAYNGYGDVTVSLSSGSAFDFNGADFTEWAYDNADWSEGATSITVDGYNGATLVGSATEALSPSGFTYLNANLDDVTSLVFNNGGTSGQWWLMDNFTYNSAPDGGSTISFLGMGLAGLVALRRKLMPKA
jgi:hypothetical protein